MGVRIFGAIIGAISLVIFFFFVWIGYPEKGKVAAFAVLSLIFGVKISWDFRNKNSFWIVIGLATAAHISAIFLINWSPERIPSIIFSPFAIADIFLISWAVKFLDKKIDA
ncbi:hypothetical protein [Novosphingobium sp.]|uniref:hypothetical protein n=1 Tax=Novosphingobium sp. TaxID=1874826 RepID=UPI003B52418D